MIRVYGVVAVIFMLMVGMCILAEDMSKSEIDKLAQVGFRVNVDPDAIWYKLTDGTIIKVPVVVEVDKVEWSKLDGVSSSDTTWTMVKQSTVANSSKIADATVDEPDSTWETDKDGKLISITNIGIK